MENCLIKIAKELNAQNIGWALGASMLLYYKGLIPKANDLDLVIALDDVERAEHVLTSLGKKQPENPHSDYATRYFGEFIIEGVDVDVIAGFRIVTGDTTIEYVPDPKTFETLVLQGETIHLCPLEDWYVLYLLMSNREERAATIKEHFFRTGANTTCLKTWAERGLPQAVVRQINALVSELDTRA